MKNILIIFLVLTSYFSINAQTNYEDVVYLKNGSVIHGIIIEQIPNVSIKIKSGQNTFVFKIDEILKMTKEEITIDQTSTNNIKINSGIEKFIGLFEVLTQTSAKLYFHVKDEGGNYTMKCYIVENGEISDLSWTHCRSDEIVFTQSNENLLSADYNMVTFRYKPATQTLVYNNGDCIDEMKKISDLSSSATMKDVFNNINIAKASNSQKTYSYNSIEKRNFNVTQLPNQESWNIELNKIESLNSNFNVAEIQNIIINGFETSKRISKGYSTTNATNNYVYEFTINSLKYSLDQGKKLISNEPYSGYSCDLSIKYKILDKKDSSLINVQILTIPGGNPKLNTSKEKAYSECIQNLQSTMKKIVWFFNPLVCNFNSVISTSNKGLPKVISLNNPQFMTSDIKIYFAIVETNDTYYEKGVLKYKKVIATGEFDKIDGANVICKIKSGEDKLKEYIDGGKNFIAISSITELEKIE
jgi:hypothetical protein